MQISDLDKYLCVGIVAGAITWGMGYKINDSRLEKIGGFVAGTCLIVTLGNYNRENDIYCFNPQKGQEIK